MKDFGLLLLRVVSGGLLAGHGAQKLFGAFGGRGLQGTSEMMEGMGLKPGEQWALMAGASEFGGGLLTAIGFLNPVGSIGIAGAMGMATAKVHWGKPIWVTSGGAEYPITNMAIAITIGLLSPGKYSLDNALHIHLPRRLVLIPGLVAASATIAMAVRRSSQRQQQAAAQPPIQQPAQEVQQAVSVPEIPSADAATEPQQPEMPEMPAEREMGYEQQMQGEQM